MVGMSASPGDRLVIRGHYVGEPVRDGEIVEILGEDGGPPYVVCWSDNGHVSRIYPGSDAYVEHLRPAREARKAGKAAVRG
jgi:hypothetical protein